MVGFVSKNDPVIGHKVSTSYACMWDHRQSCGHVKTESCGKVILCGEHGVMYGAKALGMPLCDVKMHVNIWPSIHGTHKVYVGSADLTSELSASVSRACELVGVDVDQAFEVFIHSEVPLGAGLGASASLSYCLIQALGSYLRVDFKRHQTIQMANELEKRFHGAPSGLDVTILAWKSLVSFQKHRPPVPLQKPGCFFFALVDSGMRSSTKMMCQLASQVMVADQNCHQMVAAFNEVHDLMMLALKKASLNMMASCLEKCSDLLRELSVVGEVLESTMGELIHCGALACKPTGSGGAGFVLALLPSEALLRQDIVSSFKQRFYDVREFIL